MKKISILSSALFALGALTAQAGGLLTNTNQNAAFLRNFAQEGQITLTSLYANPAGNAFLSPGWHMSINSQTAIQQRNIKTTFPYFAKNLETPGQQTHRFEGKAFAPVIPSITVSHNWDRWSLSAHFALSGGGGKCEFDKGLGSFESAYAGMMEQMVPSLLSTSMQPLVVQKVKAGLMANGINETSASYVAGVVAPTAKYAGYGMKAYMKGRSYYFGLQVGGAYKVTDNLSAYIGIRGLYATCNYNGYVNPSANINIPANEAAMFPGYTVNQPLDNYGIDLNCDQTGFGITPIFGLDWKVNDHWNVAVKYEANTRMSLKNKSSIVIDEPAVAQKAEPIIGKFADGEKIREDVPAILALGAEYSLNDKVRFDGSAKMYFDKTARKYGNAEDNIDHNTWEVALGAEYDVHKLITVSASYQSTNYGLNDKYMNDLSFNLSNNSLGLGVRINASERCNIDLGYMHTFYKDRTVVDPNPSFMGMKTDNYVRKNDVIGIGVNFQF